MPVYISMLRGVNVGGHNKIKMEELRSLYESLGLSSVRTHIQSGNIVFKARERSEDQLTKRICAGIEKRFGFLPATVLRTVPELRKVIAKNPFADRKGIDPSKLLVTFLLSAPQPAERQKLLALKIEPEELLLDGRELFVYFPNGIARPKFSWSSVEKILRVSGTARNWNTVQKLLQMAIAIESSK